MDFAAGVSEPGGYELTVPRDQRVGECVGYGLPASLPFSLLGGLALLQNFFRDIVDFCGGRQELMANGGSVAGLTQQA